MIIEYLFFDKTKREEIEEYNATITLKEKDSPDKLKINFKDFDNAEYWAIRYEYGKNSEADANYLSSINDKFVCKFAPTVLTNECAEYFNKTLYPLINKFERLLRKFLFLKVAIYDVKKFEHIIKDIESKDFGDIYNILFVDSNFCKHVRDKIKNATTRTDMIEILENAEENTAWDMLVSDGKLSLIKENFDVLKSYRNDVMHAHNIGEDTYKKAKCLFNSANSELEEEIIKMIEFTDTYHKNEDHKESLYDKLVAANENAARIGAGMVKALEVFERYSSSLLTPERLKGMEKVAELLAEALLNAQYTEPNQKELPQCEEDTNE